MRGEPIWLMIVGGSGTGKTEVAKSLLGLAPFTRVVSTIHSEGALLSATKSKEGGSSTGGLLREVGAHGMVILKDFTSILSMPERGQRPLILAALREIHDGNWARTVGVDGGRTESWKGHLGIVGCCTTSWDAAHTAIAAMGDRFTVVRINSRDMDFRLAAGRQAMANLGLEKDKDWELREATRMVLDRTGPHQKPQPLPLELYEVILQACNIASTARTPTEHDYRGKTTYSHDPEAPTRLPKSLTQMIQGALNIGLNLPTAFNMAMRCIRDSIPPIRLECLQHMHRYQTTTISDIMQDIQRPWHAIDKAVQGLYSAGIVVSNRFENKVSYSLRSNTDIRVLWTRAETLDGN